MQALTYYLIESTGVLRSKALIEAFDVVDRADFVPRDLQEFAYKDFPLSIGFGQTISQPSTVAFMLELLRAGLGMKVLDVGAGSGWQSAILARLVGGVGKVYAIERIPELCEFGEQNVEKYGFVSSGIVEFVCGDGSHGLPQEAPFDRIIVAAAARKISAFWTRQLKRPGILVCPIGGPSLQDIVVVQKDEHGALHEDQYRGFVFVPLISEGYET